MLFNSFSFLGAFGVFAVAYYAAPRRSRWVLLLAASVVFYATFDLRYVPLLIVLTSLTYVAGLRIERTEHPRNRQLILAASVALVLSALVVFKYLDFLLGSLQSALVAVGAPDDPPFPRLNLTAVAGLSFYTFSCVSYLADVYRRQLSAERHAGLFALYVAFFPKILAGPIERARPFLNQLKQGPVFDDRRTTSGLQLMLWGLFKKVVIADRLAVFVNAAYTQPAFAPPADLLLATYFFAFQLYCDFSGYSDIAIGASRVLGIELMDNFRRPYLSTSVPEFWARRWHLSLSVWFRDYLYIPLGGSRVSAPRAAVNVMTVFLLSGLWHGAAWTFVVWGGLNGIYTVLTPAARQAAAAWPRPLRPPAAVRSIAAVFLTFHLILVTWVFFRAASLGDAWTVLTRIAAAAATLPPLLAARMRSAEAAVPVALVALLLALEWLDERRPLWERLARRPVAVRWAAYYALLAALVVFGAWNFQQFVYMQF